MRATQIAERYDIAIMSTKGMSVVAARQLIDRLSEEQPSIKILVAHDCDRPGFSIFGTLGTSSRRYDFTNPVNVIDIGMRLSQAAEMGLQDEAMPLGKTDPRKASRKLWEHGVTEDEIDFMINQERRIELNAMASGQFIEWLEDQFAIHGIVKVIPDDDVLEGAARRAMVQGKLCNLLSAERQRIEAEVADEAIPSDLRAKVETLLSVNRSLSWDEAVDQVIKDE